MTDTLTLPFAPPPYPLSDNGVTFWPPEPRLAADEWPFVAEAWEKWEHDYERLAHRRWQTRFRCDGDRFDRPNERRGYLGRCDLVFDSTDAWRRHCAEAHPGVTVNAQWSNSRWTWEMLGFADHWDGKPRGWRTVIDGRDPQRGSWEMDVLELGTRAADHLWEPWR